MALSFGGSSQKSKTTSSSLSESASDRLGLNFQQSQQGTFLDPTQQQFLNPLYRQAAGMSNDLLGAGFAQNAQQLGANLGQLAWNNQGVLGGITGGQNPFMQNLLARSTADNPFVNAQISQFGGDLARQLQQNILPQVGSGFALANQYGGGRQGLAEGQAMAETMRQFGQGATNLRANAYDQGAGAAQAALAAQLDATAQSQGALQGQFELGMAGPMAGFLPLQQLQGLLGSPTVLSQGTSFGGGLDLAMARSRAESQSRTKSSGGGFSFGL